MLSFFIMLNTSLINGKATYYFMCFMRYNNLLDELERVRSPYQIKQIFYDKLKEWCKKEGKEFIWTSGHTKGMKLIEFDGIYEYWVCKRRGYDMHPSWMATELLNSVMRWYRKPENKPYITDKLKTIGTIITA